MLIDLKTREELLSETESPSGSARSDEDKCPRFPLGTIIEYEGIIQQVIAHNSSGYPKFSVSIAPDCRDELSKIKILFRPEIDMEYSEWKKAVMGMTWSQWKAWRDSGYKNTNGGDGSLPPWIEKELHATH